MGGKKQKQQNQKQQKVQAKPVAKKVKFNLPSEDEDEDAFEQRDSYINFSNHTNSSDEEAVLDLPLSEDDSEDYEEELDEEELDDEDILEEHSEEEEEKESWGKQRKNYYDTDKQAELEEEAEEAVKLQKKRLSQLTPQDFSLYAPKFKKSEITLSDDDDDNKEEKDAPAQAKAIDDSKLTEEFKQNVQQLKEVLEPFMERAKGLPRSQGLKFLSAKYQLLGNYCALIIRYLQLKLSSKKNAVNDLVDELIRHRLLLEKMKPMELKLKHQIEKLLSAQPETKTMKAGTGSFTDDIDDIGEEEEKAQVYKAPKVTPMPFPTQTGAGSKEEQKRKREEERFPELHSDYEEVPEEEAFNVAATSTNQNRLQTRKLEEREEYEEDNFVRFTLTNKEKNKLQKATKLNDELDDLEDFMNVLEKKNQQKEKPNLSEKPKKQQQHYSSDESITSESEEEELIKKAKNKKQQVYKKPAGSYRPVEDIERGAERPASKSILRNRGLTPTSRPKDIKNPRVKQRRKFERAVKRLPSLHPVAKSGGKKGSGYGGESSGIRTNISRSTKF